ncbi:MAG: cytochrome c biogenesis protein CcsA, partial [Coriobacteriales bacterium]|nr:cytochrome c biogenesis protein CcsA [Coriobacteriales bacterium]
MPLAGFISLAVTFVALVVSIGAFVIARFVTGAAQGVAKDTRARYATLASRVNLVAYIGILTGVLALTFGCALLIYCFVTGDASLAYVVKYQSNSSSSLAMLYKVAGLWGGREGSLLFWAWLIGLFAAIVALKGIKRRQPLDNMALLIIQIVLLAFVIVLLFSESNMPFIPIDPGYLDAQGHLKDFSVLMREYAEGAPGAVEPMAALGMSVLLEHWAMAIHPPTLFIGYAGLTVPFAYALATLIVKDSTKRWVERATRYTLVSWVFLGIGIGLGAIWAYVVLGWGGYWGWDPVENASLLSWILAVALVHCFTVYRQRGAFKRWSVMCACLAFAFVIVGTFITRSGIVSSVHAFEGDPVSLVLFLVLIVASVLAGAVGLALRWKSFGAQDEDAQMSDSLLSKGVAYYFNNVVLVVSACFILYLTIASALPTWMPFGGMSLSASTYNAIARPLGILYCLLMAVCPLLGWAKTDVRSFLKKARVPAVCALVAFAALLVYFVTYLKPSYDAMVALGGSRAHTMLEAGPAPYYFALTLLGFLAAALLFFNALFMLGKVIGAQAKASKTNHFAAFFLALRGRASQFGGFLA